MHLMLWRSKFWIMAFAFFAEVFVINGAEREDSKKTNPPLEIRIKKGKQKFQYQIVFTNRGKEEIRLWEDSNSWGYWNLRILARVDAEEVWITRRKDVEFAKNLPEFFTVAPGASQIKKINLEDGTWMLSKKVKEESPSILLSAYYYSSLSMASRKHKITITPYGCNTENFLPITDSAVRKWGETVDANVLLKLAGSGDIIAQALLARCYGAGINGVSKDEVESAKWQVQAAENGFTSEQVSLGNCYKYGWMGFKKDPSQAVKWFLRAAEKGNAAGQFALAMCYGMGDGVPRDPSEEIRWCRKAAYQGNEGAQVMIAYAYLNGRAVQKDEAKAVKWIQRLVDQGSVSGFEMLADCYERGRGVEKDPNKAAKFYFEAARRGDENGQYQLGRLYANGIGVEKDVNKAAMWYQKAAEQGDGGGAFEFGVICSRGEGVPRNDIEALKWLMLAAKRQWAGSEEAIEELISKMSQTQIAEAKKRVEEFIASPRSW
jgi:TPR repeat protein